MRVWTVHLPPEALGPARPGGVRRAVLLREGFAWGAALFGPFWLLGHRLWLEAVIWLGLVLLLAGLAPVWAILPAGLALQFLLGAMAQDLRAAALRRRGYALAEIVAARDPEHALVRLLGVRPELAPALGGAVLA
jgi:hypothetical protein